MEYTNRQAVAVAVACAKEYKKRLANTKLLIIYRDRISNDICYIEVIFRPSNYQHLTGLILLDNEGKVKDKSSIDFYHKCTRNNLKADEIMFKLDGTTPLKLDALPRLMDLTKITKIIGDYNHSKKWLEADVIVGGVNYCLAVSEQADETYFPRSGLLEDIRNITGQCSQVLAIFQKQICDKGKYKEIKNVAKGLDIKSLKIPDDLSEMIQLDE